MLFQVGIILLTLYYNESGWDNVENLIQLTKRESKYVAQKQAFLIIFIFNATETSANI